MLRQDLLDLFDELKGNQSRIEKGKKEEYCPDKTLLDKTAIAEATLNRFEKHFEYLTKVAQ